MIYILLKLMADCPSLSSGYEDRCEFIVVLSSLCLLSAYREHLCIALILHDWYFANCSVCTAPGRYPTTLRSRSNLSLLLVRHSAYLKPYPYYYMSITVRETLAASIDLVSVGLRPYFISVYAGLTISTGITNCNTREYPFCHFATQMKGPLSSFNVSTLNAITTSYIKPRHMQPSLCY